MEKKNKLIIAIMIVAAVGMLAIVWGTFLTGPDLTQGDRMILVLAVDETEERPGLGAVDMAFVVHMKNGNIAKYSPIYPGGLRHPSEPEPAEAGGGGKLLLHDSLWYEDTEKGMKHAKEIVEAKVNVNIDGVVAVNTKGLNAVISSAGPVKINGTETKISALDLVRENDQLHGGGMTRGEGVMALAKALSQAANNEGIRNKMVQTALDQYSKGNILMIPQGSFTSLMASKSLGSLL
ncbi:hypothetical protein ALNOE001_02750 [Candidatus Methanobinarius endosymbioticus]|uniref:DUF4012 domain-containing protein n=1 Tax=Candidatus Methanobinarius endosymbioticus TaxID=2006182 RepID=A0A366MF98_9EURY|nr:hypothetical protein ALNOE001_02750 [Candidatus Methanobinarius endosymbioticus]